MVLTFKNKRFCFTIPILFTRQLIKTDLEKKLEHVKQKLSEDIVELAIVSLEYGRYGNKPHLQGYFEFDKQRSVKQWFNLPETHFEKAKGSLHQNLRYISGVNKDYEAPGNILFEKNVQWPTNLRIHLDIKEQESRLLKTSQLYSWQKFLIDFYLKDKATRQVVWIYEKNGNSGKTEFCRYLRYYYGALPIGGKSTDVKYAIKTHFDSTYSYPKLLCIDVPRADEKYISYSSIENVKDSMFFSTKYQSEGCTSTFSPTIFIFANFEPDVSKLSRDRWKIFHLKDFQLIDKSPKMGDKRERPLFPQGSPKTPLSFLKNLLKIFS